VVYEIYLVGWVDILVGAHWEDEGINLPKVVFAQLEKYHRALRNYGGHYKGREDDEEH